MNQSSQGTQQNAEASSSATHNMPDALLQRVIEALEPKTSRSRSEILLAVLLSVATLCSTWCGYQTGQWGGLQSSELSSADTAERKAAEDTIVALQKRTFDGMAIIEFWRALRTGDQKTAQNIKAHMRPTLQKALDASLADGILTDPTKPGPLQRPEYVLDEEIQAQTMRQQAATLKASSTKAGQASSQYVLLTLMFASVLFFGGIGSTFATKKIRTVLVIAAIIITLITLFMLIQLPVMVG